MIFQLALVFLFILKIIPGNTFLARKLIYNSHINVNVHYLSNETNPGFVAITVLEL